MVVYTSSLASLSFRSLQWSNMCLKTCLPSATVMEDGSELADTPGMQPYCDDAILLSLDTDDLEQLYYQRRMQRDRESGLSYRPLAKRTGLLKKHGPASGRNKAATPPAIPATGPATSTGKNGHSGHRSGHSAQKVDFAHTTRDDRRHLLWRSIAQKWTARRARQSQKRADYAKVVGGLLLNFFIYWTGSRSPHTSTKKCASLFPSVSSFRAILTGIISEGWRCVVDGAVREKLCCLRPSLIF